MNLIDLAQQFSTEDEAREHLEKVRWADGVVCPHCGVVGESYRITAKTGSKKPVRKGVWACAPCRQQFTVTVGTVFEGSHIKLHKWLLAVHLLCASKKGMSAHQLHRMLGVTYKTAWFMAHRIRLAMAQEPLAGMLNGTVEVDETYIGGKMRTGTHAIKPGVRAKDRQSGRENKAAVLSILQRGGQVHSLHMDRVTGDNLKTAICAVVAKDTVVMTDTATTLKGLGKTHKHHKVNHSANEYVRWEDGVCITTNGVEGYFANLKRGINGVYHHVGRKHLHRYLSEFDFRYNERQVTDDERAQTALRGFDGKRLMYKDPIKAK